MSSTQLFTASPSNVLTVLQNKGKLSLSDLKKVERMQKTAVAESLPALLIKLGLCSELDVALAFVESGDVERINPEHYPQEKILPDTVSLRFLKQYHLVGLTKMTTQSTLRCSTLKMILCWIHCVLLRVKRFCPVWACYLKLTVP
jgi:hypothetical protein